MSGRRENTTKDRQRNSTARKKTHKANNARQTQQAEVLQKLLKQAREEPKSA
jgi:hypothetical protein